MLTKEDLIKIICSKIESDENLGDHSGGSGHLSYKEYSLNDFSVTEKTGNTLSIKYFYTISITNEFTIYPENPPAEFKKESEIIINHLGVVI